MRRIGPVATDNAGLATAWQSHSSPNGPEEVLLLEEAAQVVMLGRRVASPEGGEFRGEVLRGHLTWCLDACHRALIILD